MLLSLGLTATLALAANGFMIPSTMSLPKNSQDITEMLASQTSSTRIVKLRCPECTGMLSGYGNAGSEEDNSLVLYFSLENGDSLKLWDGLIYPKDKMADKFLPEIRVPLIDSTRAATAQELDVSLDILYSYHLRNDSAADGSDAKLIDMEFSLHRVDDRPVTVDTLHIRLLQGETGDLTIVDIVQVPNNKSEPAHGQDSPEAGFSILPIDKDNMDEFSCVGNTAFFCRVKSAFAAKIAALRASMRQGRPCGGLRGKKHIPQVKGGMDNFHFRTWRFPVPASMPARESQTQPGQIDPHFRHHNGGHRGGHHGPRRVFRHTVFAVQRFFLGVIVPVLIGIAAGMTASLLGMVVGSLIVFVWIKVVRRGKRGNASQSNVRAEEGAIALEEEQKGLIDDAECEFEAPPTYVEKA